MIEKRWNVYILILLISIATGACTYDFVIEDELPPITEEVSFSADIQPIFSDNCASCHNNSGGRVPYLNNGSAYNSINNSTYISTDTPEESLIYYYVVPTATTHTHRHYTAVQAQLVLTWIEQGALNN